MKKILFILPCVPYPLTAGGNQAFFNMVEYIRHKMSVSLLLSPENKEMNDVESLRALWTNVDFLKSASNLNGNLNCSKELEHYAS